MKSSTLKGGFSLSEGVVRILRVMPANEDRWERLRRDYPPILDTAQVAELLGLNVRTILNMAQDGRLTSSRIPGSRKFLFPLEDVISVLEDNLNVSAKGGTTKG